MTESARSDPTSPLTAMENTPSAGPRPKSSKKNVFGNAIPNRIKTTTEINIGSFRPIRKRLSIFFITAPLLAANILMQVALIKRELF